MPSRTLAGRTHRTSKKLVATLAGTGSPCGVDGIAGSCEASVPLGCLLWRRVAPSGFCRLEATRKMDAFRNDEVEEQKDWNKNRLMT